MIVSNEVTPRPPLRDALAVKLKFMVDDPARNYTIHNVVDSLLVIVKEYAEEEGTARDGNREGGGK